MFCPNCGKELPEDVKFCPSCGNATPIVGNDTPSPESSIAILSPVKEETIKNEKKSLFSLRNFIILVAAVCLISVTAVFVVRLSNERALKKIAVDTLHHVLSYTITSHYDPIMPKPQYEGGYEITYDESSFAMENGTKPDMFVLTGKFTINDLISEGDLQYIVSIKCDVASDFMRKVCYCSNWEVEYQDPEFIVPHLDIDVNYWDFFGTFANISDSEETLEVHPAPSTILFTCSNPEAILFETGAVPYEEIDVDNPGCSIDCWHDLGTITITCIPADYSQYGVDTIYVESQWFKNAIYTRTGYEYTDFDTYSNNDSNNTGIDSNSGLYWEDIYGMMNFAADEYMSNDYVEYTYGKDNFNMFYNTGGSYYGENPIASYDANRNLYQIFFTLKIDDPGRGFSYSFDRSILSIWRDGNDGNWYLQSVDSVS